MYLITAVQMREIESRAINELGIPALLLMESAASAVTALLSKISTENSIKKAAVFCGPGNNGGDGFAIARLLHAKGIAVQVLLAGEKSKFDRLSPEAALNLQIVQKLGLISDNLDAPPDVIIDAVFGTGLKGEIKDGIAVKAIDTINSTKALVVSVDIPSGVDADTGKTEGPAVHADMTVTFGLAKLGHMLYPGTEYAGELFVESISIPENLLQGPYVQMLEDKNISGLLPKRAARSNKGSHGRVCVIAGSEDMPGAAVLCCKAAYKMGAGLVDACTVPSVATVLHNSVPEVITSNITRKGSVEDAVEQASIVAIGPGLGRDSHTGELVEKAIKLCNKHGKPMVIDADGLMAVAADLNLLNDLKVPCVITPHPGEMSALIGLNISEVLDDIILSAKNFSEKYKLTCLLKDARTIIAAPNGEVYVNPTGSPAMAKAGSGDVLTGIISALIAQGLTAVTAAAVGAYVHGKAGRSAAETHSVFGVNASDIICHL